MLESPAYVATRSVLGISSIDDLIHLLQIMAKFAAKIARLGYAVFDIFQLYENLKVLVCRAKSFSYFSARHVVNRGKELSMHANCPKTLHQINLFEQGFEAIIV